MHFKFCYHFSGRVTVFHDLRLSEQATPAGYAALIDALRLQVPLPPRALGYWPTAQNL